VYYKICIFDLIYSEVFKARDKNNSNRIVALKKVSIHGNSGVSNLNNF